MINRWSHPYYWWYKKQLMGIFVFSLYTMNISKLLLHSGHSALNFIIAGRMAHYFRVRRICRYQ